jgi:hypothetical protein
MVASILARERILKQPFDVGLLEAGDFNRVETFEGFAESLSLAENDDPGKAGLKSFEHEQFPERAAVAHGYAPFSVVIIAKERIALRPCAAEFFGVGAHELDGI